MYVTPLTRGQCDTRPTVIFPAARHHRPLAGTKLYCLVAEAHCVFNLTACPGLHLIAGRPRFELATYWSQVQRPNHSATEQTLLAEVTRSSADADNRLDAFSGQSRSTNMVPFHMLHIVSYCATVTLSLRYFYDIENLCKKEKNGRKSRTNLLLLLCAYVPKGERNGKGEGGREKEEKGRSLPYQSKSVPALLTVCV